MKRLWMFCVEQYFYFLLFHHRRLCWFLDRVRPLSGCPSEHILSLELEFPDLVEFISQFEIKIIDHPWRMAM